MKKILSFLVFYCVLSSTYADEAPLYFKETGLEKNIEGSLNLHIGFAQTHTLAPSGNEALNQPHLTALRNALLLATNLSPETKIQTLNATVFNKNGEHLGDLLLNPPEALPNTDRPEDLDKQEWPIVQYADNTWSVLIPWEWVEPGFTIQFSDSEGETGALSNIDVGAENELVIQNIRIGMLTEPADTHQFEQDPMLAADYFQKIPVSQLTVGNYSPIHLDKVVLPNGKIYTESSDVDGSVYSGDMRENIGKSLISIGIDNANFGVNSTAGPQQWQANHSSIFTVHKSRGNYKNGIQDHGLSGGNGMATLKNTKGNEFSHELGHAYGLGHYYGDDKSLHRDNSAWGYDDRQGKFISNFIWDRSGDAYANGNSSPPFKNKFQYHRDAMAGGEASSPISSYTLYTPYSLKHIQEQFEKIGIFTKDGYKKWNPLEKKMEIEKNKSDQTLKDFGEPVVTLVGYYDPENKLQSYIYPALYGSYGHTFKQPSIKAGQCWLAVETNNGVENYPLDWNRLDSAHMNKFHINVLRKNDPTEATIYCPFEQMKETFDTWLDEHFEVKTFHSWSDNRNGTPGDIYEYHRPNANVEYFKLLKSKYGYFPSEGNSNEAWQYLDNQKELKATFKGEINSSDYNLNGKVALDTRMITYPTQEPMPAVRIGKMHGYNDATRLFSENLPSFSQIASELHSVHAINLEQFNKKLSKVYHYQLGYKAWSDSRKGKIGDIYIYQNQHQGTTDYYILLKENYGYFPTNHDSNDQWRYLGSANDYINHAINPFIAEDNATYSEYLLSVYNQKKLLDWGERNTTKENGEIFFYNNKHNDQQEYFQQRRAGDGHYFPNDSVSNNDWLYLGSEQSYIDERIKTNQSQETFEENVLSWYKQAHIQTWSYDNKGAVGDVYMYDYKGNIYYFELMKPKYSFFPKPVNGIITSRPDWKYLGEYIKQED